MVATDDNYKTSQWIIELHTLVQIQSMCSAQERDCYTNGAIKGERRMVR